MVRLHYFRQAWLSHPDLRRWQRLHFYWPNGRPWGGLGVTVMARELSVKWHKEGDRG